MLDVAGGDGPGQTRARSIRPNLATGVIDMTARSSRSSTPTTPPPDRRARRAAERRAAPPRPRRSTQTRQGRSPLVWITALVGGLGVVALVGAILLRGGGSAPVDAASLVTPASFTPAALADGRTLGKADAPVTLEVWTDFQCPICGEYARTVEPQLIAKYVTPGTLKIVHHDAAFQGAKSSAPYDESVEAGAGGHCAADQNLYWPYQDWVFANQSGENEGAFADARLRAIATAAGLDVTTWDACRLTGQTQTAVRSETSDALAAGVNATPTMRLNGQVFVGLKSATDLGTLIEAAAKAAAGG
jgi:protein-disulfide isomerase